MAPDQKSAEVIGAITRQQAVGEGEMEVHAMTVLRAGVIVKAGPRSGWKQVIVHRELVGACPGAVKTAQNDFGPGGDGAGVGEGLPRVLPALEIAVTVGRAGHG